MKLTPKVRTEIVARVRAGEKQKDVAKAYDVSKGRISQILKEHTEKSNTKAVNRQEKKEDLTALTTEQLTNRYQGCIREVQRHLKNLEDASFQRSNLRRMIQGETERLQKIDDLSLGSNIEQAILSYRKQLSYHEDQSRTFFAMAIQAQELSSILHELSRRPNVSLPRTELSLVT